MKRAIDSWRDLCKKYEQPDNLPTWEEAGKWTEDKLYFWKRYIDITTTAMTGKFSGGLIYVDLFGGAGVCTLKGLARRFPGSAIIAAHSAKPFNKIIICEENQTLADACRNRLNNTSVADRCVVLTGDCNQLVNQVIRFIPNYALTLAFIDPKGLDAEFNTVCILARSAKVDFVVLFADAIDINRNLERVYRQDPNSKLDQVLGPDNEWRTKLDDLPNPNHVNKRKLFADIYKNQLEKHLGYKYFDEKVMTCRGVPLYRLVYASRNKLGLEFWKEAVKQESSGQRNLFD
jgi:three-Cys-motif partner protein